MKKIISIILVMMCILTSITTINADEVNASEKTLSFSDVKSTHWFYNNVTEMIELGIVNGYEDGTFRPQGEIKADEFIKMVLVAMGYEPCQSDSTYWADGYITKAEELKIVDKTFINDYRYNLTREQASRIIVNALSLKETKPIDTYNEYIKTAINDYHLIADKYKQDVIDSYSWGVMQGDAVGKVNPKQTITRAEATTVILRMINKDRRLSVDFDSNTITLADGRDLDPYNTITLIPPIYNGKPLNEIIDVAKAIQNNLDISKGGDRMGYNSNQKIVIEGYGKKENLDFVNEVDERQSVTLEELYTITSYLDYGFVIDTINFSHKYTPYDLVIWKKVILSDLGYNTYDEYFLNLYKEPFEKTFKILFEKEFDTAWNYFVQALKYNGDVKGNSIEKDINNRLFSIVYSKNGLQLTVSLKDNWK